MNVLFPENVRANLVGVAVAALGAVLAAGANVEYCRGIVHCTRANALLVGLPWADVGAEIARNLDAAGVLALLDASTRTMLTTEGRRAR